MAQWWTQHTYFLTTENSLPQHNLHHNNRISSTTVDFLNIPKRLTAWNYYNTRCRSALKSFYIINQYLKNTKTLQYWMAHSIEFHLITDAPNDLLHEISAEIFWSSSWEIFTRSLLGKIQQMNFEIKNWNNYWIFIASFHFWLLNHINLQSS